MFLILVIVQMLFMRISWWVYYSYMTQPRYNHPAIFWNPLVRTILIWGPFVGIASLFFVAFTMTSSPWWFVAFSIIWWMIGSKLHKPSQTGILMPTLSEDGITMEAFTPDELIQDIRLHNKQNSDDRLKPNKAKN
ncbi:MAG: hypothetical protein A3J37_07285 [Alphaproteobacteria bacterium RIFCSPHIGHO2_12_FULL_45_9]|nr:MAG: hypothetical protein A3B66_04750 [Alphaproteobacteria bacterium RIFCSPHIGHO2_02_FULL_46_13]OFW96863.1 MAG: hypothetical protein A3J37_07285 [Alphaproteobacteria bacterium RIFCSPHIGHO2_12_FULL_45_9]